jgi:hypothetical protein
MNRYSSAFALLLAVGLVLAPEARAQLAGRVCPNPAHPCAGFQAQDLSFRLVSAPVARAAQRSEPFYAVILRSGRDCSILEADRVAAQAAFPGRKVFSQRFECDGEVENNVSYAGTAAHTAFLAVYAGTTRARAAAFLRGVLASGRWPGANLRLMRVVLNYD